MSATDIAKQTVPAITYVKKMRNYDKDPFFVKKKKMAMELIEKYGPPNSVKEKMKAANQNRIKKSRIA